SQFSRVMRLAGETLYAGWWWLVVGIGFFFAWVAVMTLPRLEWRWAVVRAIAKSVLAAVRIPITVTGRENLRDRGVMVVNHSSYMDGIVLMTVLPGAPAFVAKREFTEQIFAGSLLRRLGVAFIERHDAAGGVADTEVATTIASQGRLLVVFPEGTFTRRAGLM